MSSFQDVLKQFNTITKRFKTLVNKQFNTIVTKPSVHIINILTVNTLVDLISIDSKFLDISLGSCGSGNCFIIFTENVYIEYVFDDSNDELWNQFDNFLQVVMPILKSIINKMNLDLLALSYNVEDEYLAEDFIPTYLKDFDANNFKYVTLRTRGLSVLVDTDILSTNIVDKLYLECPECETYYKVADVVKSEHDH